MPYDAGTCFGPPCDWEETPREWDSQGKWAKDVPTPKDVKLPLWSDADPTLLWRQMKPQSDALGAYFVFTAVSAVVMQKFSDGGFSAILTLGAGVQCLGFHLLLLEVRTKQSAAGLSLKTLQLYAGVFACRLASTLFKSGYLPVDSTGDWVYQSADLLSLFLVLHLAYYTSHIHRATYQKDHDSTPVVWLVLPAVLLGVTLHTDLNNAPFFDAAWMVSTMLDAVALVPQLRMMQRCPTGMVTPVVLCLTVSRLLAFWFWVHGYAELKGHGGWLIVAAHALQLLLAADFLQNLLSEQCRRLLEDSGDD